MLAPASAPVWEAWNVKAIIHTLMKLFLTASSTYSFRGYLSKTTGDTGLNSATDYGDAFKKHMGGDTH